VLHLPPQHCQQCAACRRLPLALALLGLQLLLLLLLLLRSRPCPAGGAPWC
jgi:hypothetical protein